MPRVSDSQNASSLFSNKALSNDSGCLRFDQDHACNINTCIPIDEEVPIRILRDAGCRTRTRKRAEVAMTNADSTCSKGRPLKVVL